MGSVLLLLPTLAFAEDAETSFSLGSYGRVQASTDLSGGRGEATNIVAFGPRLEADPYAEIDLGFRREASDQATFRALLTPAVSGDPFHYDGQWEADLALRNLFAEATLATGPGHTTLWAGSRMYRGDDVYLLNFWPLDSLNTFGGGAGFQTDDLELHAHVGFNRLSFDDWQVQTWARPEPGGVGEQDIIVLDRQRRIASLKGSILRPVGPVTLRLKAYGELHQLPEGVRIVDDRFEEELPADLGSLVGVQVSAWGWAEDSYVHLFYKHATGLAAFGELTVPQDGLATDYTTKAAREHLVAVAGNHEVGEILSIAAGGYVRSFVDADGQDLDVDDRWELAVSARPTVHIGQHVGIGLEASHQWLRPNGLNPRTEEHDIPQVTKISVLPMVTPAPRTFSRPMVHLTYTMSILDEDALDWFDPLDARAQQSVHHFVGLGAEWWINSESYR